MPDDLERILLTKVPEFVGEWELKSTTPCGNLIDQVSKYPSDLSKVVVLTKGQDNAQKIAAALDNYKLFGSVIKAWYALTKPADASNVTNFNTVGADCSKNPETQVDIRAKSAETALEEHTSQQRAQPANIANDCRNHDRKRRSSATVDSTETIDHTRRGETGESISKISSRRSCSSEDSRGQKVLPNSRQNEESSQKSRGCRFCHQSGHATWYCQKKAEYYNVKLTIKGVIPPGCQWPESSIVKVEGLCAGPIIEYIEKYHLQMEKMNLEEIRIMFAWLTNYYVCHNCGAAGHTETEGLCKYNPLKHQETDERMAHFRSRFCRRMRGIREKLSFGEIQQHARRANQEFRALKETSGRRPLKCSEKMDEDHSEKPQRRTLEESEPTEKHNPPVEPHTIVIPPPAGKRIKTEPSDEHEQDEDD